MTDDRPHHAYDWHLLAAEAEAAVRRREASIDKLIERRGEEAAQAELATWRAIAEDWNWVVKHDRRVGIPDVLRADKLAALEESYRRCVVQQKKAQEATPAHILAAVDDCRPSLLVRFHGEAAAPLVNTWHRRELMAAMLWWQRREGVESIDFLVRLNIQLRKAARDRAGEVHAEIIQGVAA